MLRAHANAVLVDVVVAVAAKVIALVNDKALLAVLAGGALGEDTA